jgi:hypothetical protein
VGAAEDLAQVRDGDSRVKGRRRDVLVAEEPLDVARVGAAPEEVRRAGMAQRVRCRADACRARMPADEEVH